MFPVKDGTKCGYLNEDGSMEIKAQFKDAKPFSDGLAAVKNDDNKWGFIDSTCKYVIKAKYDDACSFSGELRQ